MVDLAHKWTERWRLRGSSCRVTCFRKSHREHIPTCRQVALSNSKCMSQIENRWKFYLKWFFLSSVVPLLRTTATSHSASVKRWGWFLIWSRGALVQIEQNWSTCCVYRPTEETLSIEKINFNASKEHLLSSSTIHWSDFAVHIIKTYFIVDWFSILECFFFCFLIDESLTLSKLQLYTLYEVTYMYGSFSARHPVFCRISKNDAK